jgi:hypothetical protein
MQALYLLYNTELYIYICNAIMYVGGGGNTSKHKRTNYNTLLTYEKRVRKFQNIVLLRWP